MTTTTDSRRWWALAALALSVLVVALDLFVLTLALPTVSADLHASSGDLQWFVDAYSLVLAAALLPAGLLGDRIGRKRLLIGALALFGIASLACAYATSAGELIAARAVLGLAAAVILPLALAVLPVLFTPAERPRAIAAVGGATFLGYPIGPILGGWLLDHFWWGSVFLINIPVVVIAVVAVTLLMPESRGERRQRIDLSGIVVSSAGLTSLTYGLIKAGDSGWSDRVAIITMVAGAAALAAFVVWERLVSRPSRAPRPILPLVDLQLFGSAGFTWGTVLSTLVSFALFGLVFAMPQYFLDVGAAADSAPPVSPKVLVTAGFAIMAAALAVGAGTTVGSSTGFAAIWFAVTGFGLGVAMPTALNAALGALSAARSGSGSALITAMRQVGGTIGVAVLGTILATVYRSNLHLAGLPAAATGAITKSVAGGVATAQAAGSHQLLDIVRLAYVHGLDVMLWVCSGIAIVSALLALAFLPGRPATQAGQAAVADDATDAPSAAATPPLDQSRMTT